MKVSNDGVTFHEIVTDIDPATGVDSSLEAAKAKGYKPYVDVTKDGKKKFTIEGSNDSLKAATDKGYQLFDVSQAKGEVASKIGGLEAAGRGFADIATMGNSDEVSGAAQAVKGAFEKGTLSDLGDDYRANRDQYREDDKAGLKQHPIAFRAGEAGAIVPQFLAGGASVVANAAKQGLGSAAKTAAIEGAKFGAAGAVGTSESDLSKGDIEGLTKDVIDGAGIGAVVGAGGSIAASGVGKVGSLIKNRGAVLSGIKEGAKEVEPMHLPGVDVVRKYLGAIKGGSRALDEVGQNAGEIAALKRGVMPDVVPEGIKIRPMGEPQSVGSGKILDASGVEIPTSVNPINEDEILGLSALGGKSRTNEYIASKAASAQPGQLDAREYQRILEMPHEQRMAARDFNNKQVASEIAPLVDELQNEFIKARGQGFHDLQSKAGNEFTLSADQYHDLHNYANSLTREAEHGIIPGKQQAEIRRALDVIENGTANIPGLEHLDSNLNAIPRSSGDIGTAQEMARFQRARQMLQEPRKYFAKNEMGTAEQLVAKLEDKIDTILKQSESKVAADSLYSKGKQVEDNLFHATEFRGQDGRTNVDEFKLAKLFNDNDSAGRFGNAIQDAREYIQNPNFSPETSQKMSGMLDRLEEIRQTAGNKRTIDSLRSRQGPSSPAIERLGSQLSKEGIPSAAINNPAGYVNSLDQFAKTYAEPVFGKGVSQLDQAQKVKLIKAFTWQQNNPKSTQAEQQKVFGKIFNP